MVARFDSKHSLLPWLIPVILVFCLIGCKSRQTDTPSFSAYWNAYRADPVNEPQPFIFEFSKHVAEAWSHLGRNETCYIRCMRGTSGIRTFLCMKLNTEAAFEVLIPYQATLQTGAVLLTNPDRSLDCNIEFSIQLEINGLNHTLWTGILNTQNPIHTTDGVIPSIDLTPFEGKRGRLVFACDRKTLICKGFTAAFESPILRGMMPRTAHESGRIPDEGSLSTLPPHRPNLILFLEDALRPDFIGAFGNPTIHSPSIDRLASQCTIFTSAYSTSSWTRPAVASILTGLPPYLHDCNHRDDVLNERFDTLPEILTRAGYTCIGFTANGNTAPEFGLAQGFHEYHLISPSDHKKQDAQGVIEAVMTRIESGIPEPFLLYIHTVDPHDPYEPIPPYNRLYTDIESPSRPIDSSYFADVLRKRYTPTPEDLDYIRAQYLGEIAYHDVQFSRFLRFLVSTNLMDSSVLCFISDHGEQFYEHGGMIHGTTLHEEECWIPMMFRSPESTDTSHLSDIPANLSQIFDTFQEAAKLQPQSLLSSPRSGRSLWQTIERSSLSQTRSSGEPLYQELYLDGMRKQALRTNQFSMIRDLIAPNEQLFSRTTDPGEQHDIARQERESHHELSVGMDEWLRELAGQRMSESTLLGELDEVTRENLRRLGYLQ